MNNGGMCEIAISHMNLNLLRSNTIIIHYSSAVGDFIIHHSLKMQGFAGFQDKAARAALSSKPERRSKRRPAPPGFK
jgi:hypothetical protein